MVPKSVNIRELLKKCKCIHLLLTLNTLCHLYGFRQRYVDPDGNMGRMQLKASVWLPRPFFFPDQDTGSVE